MDPEAIENQRPWMTGNHTRARDICLIITLNPPPHSYLALEAPAPPHKYASSRPHPSLTQASYNSLSHHRCLWLPLRPGEQFHYFTPSPPETGCNPCCRPLCLCIIRALAWLEGTTRCRKTGGSSDPCRPWKTAWQLRRDAEIRRLVPVWVYR